MVAAVMIADSRRERDVRLVRERDKIVYFALLTMPPEIAAATSRLFVEARDRDVVAETSDAPSGPPLGDEIVRLRPELAPVLAEFAQWPSVESRLYSRFRVRRVEEYFELMHVRAFCPVYVSAVLSMPEVDRRWLEAFSAYTGYGTQLIDDTLDLVEDLERGVVYITFEEFEHLGIGLDDLGSPAALRAVTHLRNQWALYQLIRAYRTTDGFPDRARRLARAFLDLTVRAVLDDRVRPLDTAVLSDPRRYMNNFGLLSHAFDLPLPSETWRTAIARPLVERVVRRYRTASLDEAVTRYASYPVSLPTSLRVDRLHGRPPFDLGELPDPDPDDRRPIRLVHHGTWGMLPTAIDFWRIFAGT
jgi:hypothetical protein